MASPNTNPRTPNPSNPSSLPPRYEIRRLDPSHSTWAAAIIIHSNLFHSPVWPKLYPTGITANAHRSLAAAAYLVDHQIASGMSFGVFDTQYVFKRRESEAAGGRLWWDASEPGVLETQGLDAESDRLLAQMDFPLASVALSYDAVDALDMPRMKPLMACLPHFGLVYHLLDDADPRPKDSFMPTARGQVLFRNATSTRRDYEGASLMAGLARWLMREAAARGYRGIQIECVHDAVTHVWKKGIPELGYRGTVISSFDTATWRDEEGKLAFSPAEQVISKVWVDLKGKAEG